MNEGDHLASSEVQPINIGDARRQKELFMARKVLSFHKSWVEIMQGEVARLEMGLVPIVNGVREIQPTQSVDEMFREIVARKEAKRADEHPRALHEVHMWDEHGWEDL